MIKLHHLNTPFFKITFSELHTVQIDRPYTKLQTAKQNMQPKNKLHIPLDSMNHTLSLTNSVT